MGIQEFKVDPFKNTHEQYDRSCLTLSRQPEYATGDVLLGSTYRALDLATKTESEVNLEEIYSLPERLSASPPKLWEFLFLKALRSPIRPGERSTKPLPQVIPLVPSLADYSGVLGKRRSRWNPGALMLEVLASGAGIPNYPSVAKKLRYGLDVHPEEDDEFAVFLNNRLKELVTESQHQKTMEDWCPRELEVEHVPFRDFIEEPLSPSEVFVSDLAHLLTLKKFLTRRQWCASIESLMRMALATHVLWVCRMNSLVWDMILKILDGETLIGREQIRQKIWSGHVGMHPFLDAGQDADRYLRRQIETFTIAKLGINLVLHKLDEESMGRKWPPDTTITENGLAADAQVDFLLQHVSENRCAIASDPKGWITNELGQIVDRETSKVSGASGPPNNLYEFLTYTLQRRRSKEITLKEHDQGYLLSKTSSSTRAHWVVRPGPVLLMAMCHFTCKSLHGAPTTLQHLANHFSYYGIRLSTGDLQKGTIANDLETLGILVDSPDAGGGRLVLDPFEGVVKSA